MRLISIIAFMLITGWASAQTTQNMKLNAGIFTDNLEESKAFYTEYLGFGITFENEFYLLLHTPNKQSEISFTKANHETQHPFFQTKYGGTGMYYTIEVEEVDALYADLKRKGIDIKIEIRDEPWGDRHFAIEDPNGIAIDIVQYSAPSN